MLSSQEWELNGDEVMLMDQLAAIASMQPEKNHRNFYVATLSGAVSEDMTGDFGALADQIISKVCN